MEPVMESILTCASTDDTAITVDPEDGKTCGNSKIAPFAAGVAKRFNSETDSSYLCRNHDLSAPSLAMALSSQQSAAGLLAHSNVFRVIWQGELALQQARL
jgi:hypothetical protein